jgi:hypothetical protein
VDWNRLLSAVIAAAALGLAMLAGDAETLIGTVLSLAFAMALVWWGEELGSLTGLVFSLHPVDQASPGWMVQIFGWIFLLAAAAGTALEVLDGAGRAAGG